MQSQHALKQCQSLTLSIAIFPEKCNEANVLAIMQNNVFIYSHIALPTIGQSIFSTAQLDARA